MILPEYLGDILASHGSDGGLVLLLAELLAWYVGALAAYGRSWSIDGQVLRRIHLLGVGHIPQTTTYVLSPALQIVDLLQSVCVVGSIWHWEMVNTDVTFDAIDRSAREC